MERPDWGKMLFTLLLLCVALVLVVSTLLMMRYRPPRKDEAAVLYRKFTRKVGIAPTTGETPIVYADRVRLENGNINGDVNDVTNAYLAARYGPANADALQALRNSVNDFSR